MPRKSIPHRVLLALIPRPLAPNRVRAAKSYFPSASCVLCLCTVALLFASCSALCAAEPINIFRSVGPGNTAALDSGTDSKTITIKDSMATFGGAGLPDTIGVGDVVLIDSDNDHEIDILCFIQGRKDKSSFEVKAANGEPVKPVANASLWTIYRAYTALGDALVGKENSGIPTAFRNFDSWEGGNDLVQANAVWNIACYGDNGKADGPAVINNWKTGPGLYVRIYTPYSSTEVGRSQRHAGKWDSEKYRIESTIAKTGILSPRVQSQNYARIEGLQFLATSTAAMSYDHSTVNLKADSSWVTDCIVKHEGPPKARPGKIRVGIHMEGIGCVIRNNIVYGYTGDKNAKGINLDCLNDATNRVYLCYNNTIVNCTQGLWCQNVQGIIINNLAVGCSKGFDTGSGLGNQCDYNSSNTGDGIVRAPLKAELSPWNTKAIPATDIFVDPAKEDFHIRADAVVRGMGLNLFTTLTLDAKDKPNTYGQFSKDIDGNPRPASGMWSLGADEPTAPVRSSP